MFEGDIMNIEKRQRLIEVLISIGSLVGIFLAVFQMSVYVFTIFPLFILFSLIYYISALENYERSASNLLVSLMISLSFSSLFIILLARGMSSVSMFEIGEISFFFGILSFLLTLELSGHIIDIKIIKNDEKTYDKKKS
jgi:hypothetical protein